MKLTALNSRGEIVEQCSDGISHTLSGNFLVVYCKDARHVVIPLSSIARIDIEQDEA